MNDADQLPGPSGGRGEGGRSAVRRFLLRLLGPALLVALLFFVDLRQVLEQLRGLSLAGLATASLAFLCLLACRLERWVQLLIAADLRLPRRQAYLSCLHSIWLGLVTPGRLGEFKRGLDLKAALATPLSVAWSLVLTDLLTDVAIAVILFAIIMLTSYISGVPALDLEAIPWLWLVLAVLALAFLRPLVRAVGRAMSRVSRLAGVGALLVRLGGTSNAGLIRIAVLAVGALAFYTIMMLALMRGIDPSLSYLDGLAIVSVAFVMGMIPITYFGLGTREAALVALFVHAGRTPETAIAISFTFVAAQILGAVISLALEAVLRIALSLRRPE